MKLASIDIGSNSIKLLVVDAAAGDSFAVLAREKEVVRLGHNTLREGHLSEDAIRRAGETIKRFRSIAHARGATRIFATATASVREANNPAQFIREVEQVAGVRVEILSGIEEARLIGIAASFASHSRHSPLLNVDIGGGSTEISLMRNGQPSALVSVKLGAVGLTESIIQHDPPTQEEVQTLKEEIREALERPGRELNGKTWEQASGTSGTITSLAGALRAATLVRAPRQNNGCSEPEPADIVLSALARFNARVSGMNITERRALPFITSQRAEIIIAGGHILEGVMRALRINYMSACDWALREGVIIDRLREIESESRPPLPNIADPRLRSVHALGRRYGYEEAHANHVARLAEQLFDAFAPSAGLTRHQRTLLSAAAILHDIGYHIAHEAHHKHSLYLIRNSELTGFSEGERNVIANVARYHRGAPPKERHPEFAALNADDRRSVWQLGALLRVAESLDKSHDGRVFEIRCAREGEIARIQMRSAGDCEKEIWAAENRSEMLAEAFGCRPAFAVRHVSLKQAG